MGEDVKKIHKRLRSIYNNMTSRCYNENAKDYKYYGGRGIKLCMSWKKSFACFCIWALTNGYEENLTLDRIDSSKDYSPENCRWVSWDIQNRNKSQTRNIEINGQVKCLKDWCKELGLEYHAVAMKIYRGVSEKEALGIYE
jgi:hypothetical protein